MIIADGRDVLRHDFHSHSLQSACGIHTVAEILHIAAQKGVETVNICDHGDAAGRKMNFGVIANRKRTPMQVRLSVGAQPIVVRLLAGIEANILDDGETDLPLTKMVSSSHQFAMISGGFHSYVKELKQWKDPYANFEALSKYVARYPIDILTHPCIESFPLPVVDLVKLAKENQIALEVNNTNLVVEKTNLDLLQQMIEEARTQDVTLLCNSDGHTWHELFECGAVRTFVEDAMNLVMEEVFPLNFGEWEHVCTRFPRIYSQVEGSV
jgi:putative hydrolase